MVGAEAKDETVGGRVVVTGASTGIGAATVRAFRAAHRPVTAVARRQDRLAELASTTGCDFVVADLTRDADVARLVDDLSVAGPVTTLVNNAGGARGLDSVESGSADDWRWMFEANVMTTKLVTSALLPLLRDGAEVTGGAEIVTVTSIAGHVAYEGGGGYNAAKFAAHALMAVLRLELAGEPIRVIEIAPGLVHTEEFSLNRFGGDRARADAVYAEVPDPLSGDDVAEAIAHAVGLPAHVDLDLIVVKPTAQAAPTKLVKGPLSVKRG